ncbi:MAG: isoprenylcysteine carboxylmethyltransferase family protein [Woeseiaceae bacterium]|nr:isoprenylcysteine carboxylmethyltransferase family protein [Woeseiaceae bacterium]
MISVSEFIGRCLVLLYGLVAYLVSLGVLLYAVGFLGNAWVPRTIDSVATAPLLQSLLINVGLIALFGLQHSVMARPWFKRLLANVLPEAAERSTYVLTSSVALVIVMMYWQPLGGVVWDVRDASARALISAIYFSGWLFMMWATFMMCHADLFGIRQAWFAFRKRPYKACEFKTPAAYRVIRHPIYTGWIVVLWATPTMTLTHLAIAAGLTAYVAIGIGFEERDLIERHPDYEQYRRKVPALLPSLRRHLQTRGNTIVDR